MNSNEENDPHASVFDIPGWPCPPRVSDIPHHENSWGYVPLSSSKPMIMYDELGKLWIKGDAVPAF